MSLQPKHYYSFEDYLAAERECTDAKHEYVAGQVFAMVGATYNHNLIAPLKAIGLLNIIGAQGNLKATSRHRQYSLRFVPTRMTAVNRSP